MKNRTLFSAQKKILLCSNICLLSIFLNSAYASPCQPNIDKKQQQFLIGYGSLIENASKNRTYPNTGENIPVEVSGFKRGWYTKGSDIGFSTTFLGVQKDNQAKFNGVIFKLPSNNSILKYDIREKTYCRELVSIKNIHPLTSKKISAGQYWIYVPTTDYSILPSDTFPIVESYVDIFISGCLEIEKKYKLHDFAVNCIKTTSDWSPYWVNDRIYPRRPWIYQPNALEIDALLQKTLPSLFKKIELEQAN